MVLAWHFKICLNKLFEFYNCFVKDRLSKANVGVFPTNDVTDRLEWF
jgi:hypothetical protein